MGPKKKKGDGSEDTGKPKNSKLNKMNEMDRVTNHPTHYHYQEHQRNQDFDQVKYLERRMAEEQEGKKRKEEMVAGYLRCFSQLSSFTSSFKTIFPKAQVGP